MSQPHSETRISKEQKENSCASKAQQHGVSRRDLLRAGIWGAGTIALGGALPMAWAQSNQGVGGNVAASTSPSTSATAIHPRVYATPADVMRARENVAQHEWAKTLATSITTAAKKWLAREDDWIRSVVPGPEACYAYGFTGCPICGANWGQWDKVNTSFEMAGHVKCANGHVLPDAEHPDAGTGYVNPDGRIHYFVGSYNAWVIEQLTAAATNLAHSYALTGDERYANKAAVILDALAAMYPTCTKGSWDYPSNPPSGRFNRPWFQVARILVIYTEQYDHIYHCPALDEPSVTAGLTRRSNIEENLLKNGAAYCYKESRREEPGKTRSADLSNGSADYIRGSMAVGICLDIPEYIKWAVDGQSGIYSMLDNNVGRDGTYYETSSLYAAVARSLYTSFAEPLFLYRGSAYPQGVNLYEHPKFRNLLKLHNSRQILAGHQPAYGDTSPDTARIEAPERPTNANDILYLERLYARTMDERERQEIGQVLNWLSEGDVEARRVRDTGNDRWRLFHARPVPKAEANSLVLAPAYAERLQGSTVLGQKGLAVLRTAKEFSAAGQQGVALRYGPSLSHGHYDDLNINFVSHGYEMTYDIGYGLGSTHTQIGWAKQTASHNLVMVDETPQGHGSASGGSLLLFADLPGVKLTEAASESSYAEQGVTLYQRTLAMIDGYVVDIFRVHGGKQHDYLLHTGGKSLKVEGVALGPVEPGSLAGPEISWGSKQLIDGDMEGHPNRPYWNPPPGNGYGFLVEPRRGTTSVAWSASWGIDKQTGMRLHVPAEANAQVLTALAPGIVPGQPKMRCVVNRRKANGTQPLQSVFAGVLEPYQGAPMVRSVERLPVAGAKAAIEPVALRITKENTTDFVYSANDAQKRDVNQMNVAAHFVHAHLEGVDQHELTSLALVGGKSFEGLGWSIKAQSSGWSGSIRSVDAEQGVLTTRAALPEGEVLRGQIIMLSNSASARNSAYRIRRVERAGANSRVFLDETTILGRGLVTEIKDEHTLVSSIPHEYARKSDGGSSGFFVGKQLRDAQGNRTQIKAIKPGATFEITVASTRGFQVGTTFFYHDVQEGDSFVIHNTIAVERLAPQRYEVQSLAPVRVKAPHGIEVISRIAIKPL